MTFWPALSSPYWSEEENGCFSRKKKDIVWNQFAFPNKAYPEWDLSHYPANNACELALPLFILYFETSGTIFLPALGPQHTVSFSLYGGMYPYASCISVGMSVGIFIHHHYLLKNKSAIKSGHWLMWTSISIKSSDAKQCQRKANSWKNPSVLFSSQGTFTFRLKLMSCSCEMFAGPKGNEPHVYGGRAQQNPQTAACCKIQQKRN